MHQQGETAEGTVQAAVIVEFCNADTKEEYDCMNKQYVVSLVCQTEHYESIGEICVCMFSFQPLKLLSRGSSGSIPSAPPF